MTTDTCEKVFETLIVRAMTGRTDVRVPAYVATETSAPVFCGTGWILGDATHYDREYCADLVQLRGFLSVTFTQGYGFPFVLIGCIYSIFIEK